MKHFLFAVFFMLISSYCLAQNIGIGNGVPHPSAMLDVNSSNKGLLTPRMLQSERNLIPSPATGLLIYQTDNTAGYYFYNGIGWVQLAVGSSVNYWSVNGSNLFNNSGGNVGIGTSTPADRLTVQAPDYGLTQTYNAATIGTWIGSYKAVISPMIGTKSNHPLYFFTNNGLPQMTLLQSGNVGIGIDVPANKLQIGGTTPGYGGNHLAIGNGTQAMVLNQGTTNSLWQSNTNIVINPKNATGSVGINTTDATNTLQIGSIGTSGFTGNNLAIGNGTNAMALYQAEKTLISSTTDIVLMPRNNGHGRVGINTNSPKAPLDVDDEVAIPQSYSYMTWESGALDKGIRYCSSCTAHVSIYAANAVFAGEFDAVSDARIKDIKGVSNSVKDLETIDALRITDYTLKDKIKNGDKPFKKVIAQEVEMVYPQVVSVHRDFIPNVYSVSNHIEKTTRGYCLSFAGNHNISKDAKKLRVLLAEGEGMQSFDIISIPSENKVEISATNIRKTKVFVYGEEVDDFRAVDYEGLTTLNISATQELSKLVKKQQATIDTQAIQIAALTEAIKTLTGRNVVAKH